MDKSDFDTKIFILFMEMKCFMKYQKLNTAYVKEIGWFQGMQPRFGNVSEVQQYL